MNTTHLFALALFIALSTILLFVSAKEELIQVERTDNTGSISKEHNHAQSVKENPLTPPKSVDDTSALKKKRRRFDNRRGENRNYLFDTIREGEKLLNHPLRRMNNWMHSMFDRKSQSQALNQEKRLNREPYTSSSHPLSYNYNYDHPSHWHNNYPRDSLTWPSTDKLLDKWMDNDDFPFGGDYGHLWPSIPFHSRFDKIASSVNEKGNGYTFKIINVPDQLKKDDLSVKLTNEAGRHVLDITTTLDTDEEHDFFEKRYVFPALIDEKSIKAKFDDKERVLIVKVTKRKDHQDNLIKIQID